MPILAPPYYAADATQQQDTSVNPSTAHCAPGLSAGRPTKLPVFSVLVLGWCAPAQDDGFSGFQGEKEQIAYFIAEQVSMAMWNAVVTDRDAVNTA